MLPLQFLIQRPQGGCLHRRLAFSLAGKGRRMVSTETNDPLHGSYHWYSERVVATGTMLALALVPFPSLAHFADASLMVFLPLHTYQGLSAVIVDYLPKRKFGAIYTAAKGILVAVSGVVVYGFYKFNTENIGLSAAIRKLWRETKHKEDS